MSPFESLGFRSRMETLSSGLSQCFRLAAKELLYIILPTMSLLVSRGSNKGMTRATKKMGRQSAFEEKTFHSETSTPGRVAVVQKAKAALFIGFSFRDEYINTILSDLPQKTPKFVITKSAGKQIDNTPPTGAPLTGNCLHWRGGFTEETAEDCLGEISAATGRPLDS